MDEINQKLDILAKAFPEQDDQSLLADWAKTAKQAVMTSNLADNGAVKLIITQYQNELASINDTLQNTEALFKSPDGMSLGLLLHTRKKWCNDFLKIFEVAKSTVVGITNTIDNAIQNEN